MPQTKQKWQNQLDDDIDSSQTSGESSNSSSKKRRLDLDELNNDARGLEVDDDESMSERDSSSESDDDGGPVILRAMDCKGGSRWNNQVDDEEEASSSDESQKGNDKKQYLEQLQQIIEEEKCKHSELQINSVEEQPVVELNILNQLNSDASVPFYPLIIESTAEYANSYSKQFGEIIGKKLQKKAMPVPNMDELQLRFRKNPNDSRKFTIIVSLDRLILTTNLYKDQLPKVDGTFSLTKTLKLYVCLRPFARDFLRAASKYFELVVWTSSQQEYSDKLIGFLE